MFLGKVVEDGWTGLCERKEGIKKEWRKRRKWWRSKEELEKARCTMTREQEKSEGEKNERKGKVRKEDHNSFQHIEVEYRKDGEKTVAFFPRGDVRKIRCRKKTKKTRGRRKRGVKERGLKMGLQAKANTRQGKMNKRDMDAGTRTRFWTFLNVSTSLCKVEDVRLGLWFKS